MYALSMGSTEPNLHLFHIKILLGSKIKSDDFESQKSCHSPRIIPLNNVMTPTSSASAVVSEAVGRSTLNRTTNSSAPCVKGT